MLPEGWQRLPLGAIAQITSGGTPDRATPHYWGGNIPWVTTGEIQFNTITDTDEKITQDGLKNSSAKLFPPNTLLIAMYGQGKTRGQVARLGIHAATNQACAAIILNGGNDPEFYFQVLSSHYEAIRELGNAGTQQNLNGGIIKQISVPVPPPIEQKGIAQMIRTWDSAIATTERLLANSHEQKRALLQSLLSDKHRKKKKLQPLPRKHASDVFAPNSMRRNVGLELLSVMQDVGVVPRSSLARKVAMPEGSTDGYKLVEPGDFVISLRSFEGGLEYSRYAGLVSPAYTVLKAKRKIDDDFYRHYFKSREFIGRLSVAVIGIRDGKQISYEDFSFLRIPTPTIDEQKRISKALNLAEAIIARHKSELEKLRNEKAGLMQQLLTGKRRVKVANA